VAVISERKYLLRLRRLVWKVCDGCPGFNGQGPVLFQAGQSVVSVIRGPGAEGTAVPCSTQDNTGGRGDPPLHPHGASGRGGTRPYMRTEHRQPGPWRAGHSIWLTCVLGPSTGDGGIRVLEEVGFRSCEEVGVCDRASWRGHSCLLCRHSCRHRAITNLGPLVGAVLRPQDWGRGSLKGHATSARHAAAYRKTKGPARRPAL
jgi:hypothetical protein